MGYCWLRDRNVHKLRKQLGLPDIVAVATRGGDGNAKYLYMRGGTQMVLLRDGTLKKSRHAWVDLTQAQKTAFMKERLKAKWSEGRG